MPFALFPAYGELQSQGVERGLGVKAWQEGADRRVCEEVKHEQWWQVTQVPTELASVRYVSQGLCTAASDTGRSLNFPLG